MVLLPVSLDVTFSGNAAELGVWRKILKKLLIVFLPVSKCAIY